MSDVPPLTTPVARGYLGPAGNQVHYRAVGHGPVLVLLAPIPRSSNYYLTLMRHLPDFRVVALDTPGFGLSDPMPGEWSMFDVAQRLALALDDLGLDEWNLLGIHSGNKIGAALCHERPQATKRFFFAGMTHSIILDNAARNERMRAFYASPDALPGLGSIPGAGARLEQRWRHVRQSILAMWDSCDPSKEGPAAATEREAVLRQVADEVRAFDSFDRLYRANFAFDLEGALRSMPVETVVMEMLVPEEDHIGRQADVLVAAIPRARAVALRGTDRRLVSTQAAELADALRAAATMAF